MRFTTDQPAIFSATLGLAHPWQVVSVAFAKKERRLDITVDFVHGSTFTCPECGIERPACEMSSEVWYHQDFFKYETYLHARVPRIDCCCCGIMAVERPWTRAGSKFSPLCPTQ